MIHGPFAGERLHAVAGRALAGPGRALAVSADLAARCPSEGRRQQAHVKGWEDFTLCGPRGSPGIWEENCLCLLIIMGLVSLE